LHPFDTLLNDLVDRLALSRPPRLVLTQGLGNVLAVAEPVFQGVDSGAGIIDREVRVIDAEPFGPLSPFIPRSRTFRIISSSQSHSQRDSIWMPSRTI
jgi:hypothetical protein